jgi:hypothetical protein
LVTGTECFCRLEWLGNRVMATYLNPDSDVMPCMTCGRDVSSLLFQSMTMDVACRCGAPIVIGRAFGETSQQNANSRRQM